MKETVRKRSGLVLGNVTADSQIPNRYFRVRMSRGRAERREKFQVQVCKADAHVTDWR
jgi:hypothetical protein